MHFRNRKQSPEEAQSEREFYESMAAARAAPYYDQEVLPSFSPIEQVVRIVAGLLSLFLALRFVLGLFTSNTSNEFVNILVVATDWLVSPFASLFGNPPTNGGGYLDLPALAAIVAISIIAWTINQVIRRLQPDEK